MTSPPAPSASLTVTPAAPNHGDTVTAVYSVAGNDPVPPYQAVISGKVEVGGQPVEVSTNLTMPGVPAQPVVYDAVAGAGLDWTATSDPAVYTAVVP